MIDSLPADGDTHDLDRVVDSALLTPAYGKPDIEVLASPAVVYLMELASIELVEAKLPAKLTSVGAALEFKHLKPTYEGATVTTRATVEKASERQVDLVVETFEGATLVAKAQHSRAIVPRKLFQQSTDLKK